MTWLTDSYDVTGWYLLSCVVLAVLGTWAVMAERVRVAQEDRRRARQDACAEGARVRGAAAGYRRSLAPSGRPLAPRAPRPAAYRGPDTETLREWGWLRRSTSTSWRPTTAELVDLVGL